MDDIIITLLVGAFIGWVASILMRTNAREGPWLNLLVGIVGAGLAAWLFGDVLHIGGVKTEGALHLVGLLWGVLGACVFVALLRVLRQPR